VGKSQALASEVGILGFIEKVVSPDGFEPSTLSLKVRCSTD
jgi:hypothetical protein